jgi:hypothetical protein
MLRRLFAFTIQFAAASAAFAQWSQFGANPRHTGSATIVAQPLVRVLAEVVHDPLVPAEIDPGSGDLFVHYAAPLLDGDDVFMTFKEATSIGPQGPVPSWSVHRLHWENGQLADKWSAPSDWQPVPRSNGVWEPVMQSVLANGSLYAPAAGGTLLQIDRSTGATIRRIKPFPSIDSMTFLSGPPTADAAGNIVYGAFRLQENGPWSNDVMGAWLVRVTPAGIATAVPFSPLVPNAPSASAQCTYEFPFGSIQHPPRQTPSHPQRCAVPNARVSMSRRRLRRMEPSTSSAVRIFSIDGAISSQ